MSLITRIVRLSFEKDRCSDFEALYESVRQKIQAMPGCLSLSLKKDATHPNVYYTLSTWTSLEALDAYRHSPLFKETWATTKSMFDQKAEAYSLVDFC